jgi:hypothetical protein
MSGEDNFIARWSRRKRQAAHEKRDPRAGAARQGQRPPDADAEQPAAAKSRPGHAPAKPAEIESAFDPATLPPIESIVAGSDIRAFLEKGVPAALTKAALRRAWTTDPAIRDFIEVAENQWDFTDPTAIPGFGPLQATDSLRQLVGQALGNLPEAPNTPDAAEALPETPEALAGAKAASATPNETRAEDPAMHTQAAALPERSDNLDTPGVTALQHSGSAHDVGNAPRRKGHGRAMPR